MVEENFELQPPACLDHAVLGVSYFVRPFVLRHPKKIVFVVYLWIYELFQRFLMFRLLITAHLLPRTEGKKASSVCLLVYQVASPAQAIAHRYHC